MKNRTDKKKLRMWQERLSVNDAAYEAERAKMDHREAVYLGDEHIKPMVVGERTKKTPHVRNVIAELIEAQVNSSIPQPKVTARRKKDERLAKIIEDMLRNELDRMPFEMMNDIMERTVPLQGAGFFLVEWDSTLTTHETLGELNISYIHPKQIVPQDGVYTGVEDMDYVILKLPQTKEYIKRKYDIDVEDEGESEPEIKGTAVSTADDMVTQYVAYYRNKNGGIGLYSWVNDTQLEDIEDYQARRLRRCKKCGAAEPVGELIPTEPTVDGVPTDIPLDERREKRKCPYCGGDEWEAQSEEYEEVYIPITRRDGSVIPGAKQATVETGEMDDFGMPITIIAEEPTRIPFYKPNIYPVIQQKNVSVFGKFLGDSDVDKVEDQQNTINRMEAKAIDQLLKCGSYMTLPPTARIKVDAEDGKIIRLDNPADKQLIGVYNMQSDVSQTLTYLGQVYEEARQIIGITDSFQGRADSTANSGKAKEFAAAQSAGRLESKRVMKNAAYAALFEAMFKFKLAYADEPRPIVSKSSVGDTEYDEFNRYEFLEQDEAGEWYWNDQFLFSCDTTAPLANNREAMWQETRNNLQMGAFGDPTQLDTLITYWAQMEKLHYPTAAETKATLEEKLKQQTMQGQANDNQLIQQVVAKAKADAQRDAQAQRG